MAVASWETGHNASHGILIINVCQAKPIRHHRGKATGLQCWTGERARTEDVVVDGSVSWVCEQTVQRLTI